MDIERSDDGLDEPRERFVFSQHKWDTLVAIGLGSCLGAEARYGISRWIRNDRHTFATATLLINSSGSLLIGVLMGVIGIRASHRLIRPFVGVGILGGYTTFSTFAVEADQLVRSHHIATAGAYVVSSVLGCLLAVFLGWRAGLAIASHQEPVTGLDHR